MKRLTIAFVSLALIIASSGFAATKKGGKVEEKKNGAAAKKNDPAKGHSKQKAKEAADHKDAVGKSK